MIDASLVYTMRNKKHRLVDVGILAGLTMDINEKHSNTRKHSA